MTVFSPSQFVAEALSGHNDVSRAEPLDDRVVEVHRKRDPSFIVGVVSAALVERATIEELADDNHIEFICNIPREAAWTGEAIGFVQQRRIAFGGIGDLFAATGRKGPVRDFVRSEFEFIERIFDQHSAVAQVERVYDRVYCLHRLTLPPVTVALINEYDLTADHIRTAWKRYGPFSDALANNPNCRCTPEAQEAAKQLKVELLPLRQFMGRLNSR
jgi:hypothetical protein